MMSPVYTLRPDQEQFKRSISAQFAMGRRRVVGVAATSFGKTVVSADMIASTVARNHRCLFLAPKRELITQTSEKLKSNGIPHGIIMASHPQWMPHLPVQVASRDTLVRRMRVDRFRDVIGDFKLVIEDEAHHSMSPTVIELRSWWPDAYFLGLTATPQRGDKKGLAELFDVMIKGPTVRQLIDMGALADFEGIAYDTPDLSEAIADQKRSKKQDYDDHLMDKAMRDIVLGGSIIRDYKEFADGKRALAFCVNVDHSHTMLEQARKAGIKGAVHVDANTPDKVRWDLFRKGGRIEQGDCLFVTGVGIFVEGTDIPSLEVGILARPVGSIGLARQILGRLLRTSRATGKTIARFHDHAGVMLQWGLPDDEVPWALTYDKPLAAAPTKTCKKCRAVVAAGVQTCPRCGEPFETIKGLGIEVAEDATARRLTLDELRARRPADARALTDRQLRRVTNASLAERMGEFLRLQDVQRDKGLKPGFPGAAYRELFGAWPDFTPEQLADAVPAERPFIPLPARDKPPVDLLREVSVSEPVLPTPAQQELIK